MQLKHIILIGLLVLSIGNAPLHAENSNNPFMDAPIKSISASSQSGAGSDTGTITGIVRAKWLLNVRASPWGKIVDGYKPGRQVKIVARKGDWYKIVRGNGYAYVHTSLIEVKNQKQDKKDSNDSPDSSSNSSSFSKAYKKILDLVKKFCNANKAYVLGAAHSKSSGIVSKSDCSGFTGQFIQKLSAMAGVKPVTGNSYPSSTNYAKSQYTKKVTSKVPPTNPRDLVKPGDIFVMSKSTSYGHVGVFMGYDSAGRPLIAHSTTRASKKGTTTYGNIGTTGVRIEPIPSWYKQRWMGVYRLNNMDTIMKKINS
ncbi:MAG TPA: SH3 domain-containing protein [Candidatus Rifleibacterium sp.]|nr:SH3 domain-containing protein [Candidatus Rifleibacterium sp.]